MQPAPLNQNFLYCNGTSKHRHRQHRHQHSSRQYQRSMCKTMKSIRRSVQHFASPSMTACFNASNGRKTVTPSPKMPFLIWGELYLNRNVSNATRINEMNNSYIGRNFQIHSCDKNKIEPVFDGLCMIYWKKNNWISFFEQLNRWMDYKSLIYIEGGATAQRHICMLNH